MKIEDAERMVTTVYARMGRDDPARSTGSYPVADRQADVEDSEFQYEPILPFFPVLLKGAAAVSPVGDVTENDLNTVDYVRVVYIAIALNWVIDFIGLSFLFHTYLVTWESPLVWLGVPLFMGAVLSTGLATFAVGLVRKPIRRPRITSANKTVLIGCAGVAVAAACIVYVGGVYEDLDALWIKGLISFGWAMVTFASFGLLFAIFGVMDAVYLLTRGVTMVAVGYIVAQPLHEVMFRKEIRDSYIARHQKALTAELDDYEKTAQSLATESTDECMKKHGLPEPRDCSANREDTVKAELLAAVWNLVANDERTGRRSKEARADLRRRAKAANVPEALAPLEFSPGRPGKGVAWEQYMAEASSAKSRLERAKNALAGCRNANLELDDERRRARAECVSRKSKDRDGLPREHLEQELNRFLSGDVVMGAIDRALELEHLTHRQTDERSIGSEADARWVVESKMYTAWILAFLMPLIVLVMKITGGKHLEPYLQRRWNKE